MFAWSLRAPEHVLTVRHITIKGRMTMTSADQHNLLFCPRKGPTAPLPQPLNLNTYLKFWD